MALAWDGVGGLNSMTQVCITLDESGAAQGRYVGFSSRHASVSGLASSAMRFQGTDGRDRVGFSGYHIVDATNLLDGSDLSAPFDTKIGSSTLSAGQKGCLLSHLRVLKALANDDDFGPGPATSHLWVWEDDACPCADFNNIVKTAYDAASLGSEGFDILQLGFGSSWNFNSGDTSSATVNRIPGLCTQCYIIKKSVAQTILDFVASENLGTMVPIDRILCFLTALVAMGDSFADQASTQYRYARRMIEIIGPDMGITTNAEFFESGGLGQTLAMNYGIKGYSFWKGIGTADDSTYSALAQFNTLDWHFTELESSSGTFSRDRGVVFQTKTHPSAIWTGDYDVPD